MKTHCNLPSRNVAGGQKPVCTPPATSRAVFSKTRQRQGGGGWVALSMVVWLAASAAFAQPFAIDQHVIGGGGGTSNGGQFALIGTIGQPGVEATLTGGTFSLESGLWSAYTAVQTPGAPMLVITRVGNNIEITWPVSGSSGFVLQGTTTMGATPNWVEEDVEPTVVDGFNKITLTIQPGNHFFRLGLLP